jgi:hypothetical protein
MKTASIHRLLLPLAGAMLLAFPLPALADTAVSGTVNVAAGSLAITSPTALDFGNVTLTGADQSPSGSDSLTITDATGSGAGWSLSVGAAAFSLSTDNTKTLGATALTATLPVSISTVSGIGPTSTVSGSSATVPTTGSIKILNASVGTGMGQSTATPSYTLTIPAQAYRGSYTSTVTYTLAATP